MASQLQQVLYQTRQNIHALKEETKKQEHTSQEWSFQRALDFRLAADQPDQVSSSDQP